MKKSMDTIKLRKQAEKIAAGATNQSKTDVEDMSPANVLRLLHELQVYRIELELQNEQLQQAQDELEKKVAERTAELSASEKRYHELFEAESDAIVLIDNTTGFILDANSAMLSLYKYDRAELLTKKHVDLSAELEKTLHSIDTASTAPDQVQHIPLRFHRKSDGSIFPVEINARLFTMEGRLVIISAIRDITERKQKDDILQAQVELSDFSNTHSLDELLKRTLNEAELLTGSSIGFFHFVGKDQHTLCLQMWSTNTLETMCSAEGKGEHNDVKQAGVWADCLRQRRPIIHNDYINLSDRKGLPPGHSPVTRELIIP